MLMSRHCLYCDKVIDELPLSFMLEDDPLCTECCKSLKAKWRHTYIQGCKIYYLYDYSSFFKDMLLQYKEGPDEALKIAFLGFYKEYFRLLFKFYDIVYVPSTIAKSKMRGFLPMEEIMKPLGAQKYAEVYLYEERIQSGKNYRERQKMRSNYYLKKKIDPRKRLMIVDDVLTTGSSLLGVYDLFKDKCRHILLFCLANVGEKTK